MYVCITYLRPFFFFYTEPNKEDLHSIEVNHDDSDDSTTKEGCLTDDTSRENDGQDSFSSTEIINDPRNYDLHPDSDTPREVDPQPSCSYDTTQDTLSCTTEVINDPLNYDLGHDTDSSSSSSSFVYVKRTMSKAEKAEYQKRRRWEYSLFEDYRIKERDRSRVSNKRTINFYVL